MSMRVNKRKDGDLIVYECILVSSTGGAASGQIRVRGRRVKQVEIISGVRTPTNAWGLTLKNSDGVDILGGNGASITSSGVTCRQLKASAAVMEGGTMLVNGSLVLAGSSMGNTKEAMVKVYTEPASIDTRYGV